ncbi:MAG: serine hydrolase domain-containing protein [Myxococcales bacterium]
MDLFNVQRLGAAAVLAGMAVSSHRADEPGGPGGTPLARCIAAEAQKLEFSGVVSIVQRDATTAYAQGLLGAPGTSKIDQETRFNLASAGKMFTAVAVAQLVDGGKLRMNDPIGLHLTGLTPKTAAVTVRQLLTHSSGLGNFFSPGNLPVIEKARTVSDLLPLVSSEEPSFAPGSRLQYSNTGFLLLGALIERVAGLGYGEYLKLHVFGPAGMVSSGLDPGPVSSQATGMTTRPVHTPHPPAGPAAPSGPMRSGPGPGERRPQGPLRPAPESALHGTPAGGSYSTATDLQRFFAALMGAKLTSAAMLKEIVAPQIVASPAKDGAPRLDYGFGFGVGAVAGHRWFGHNGGAPGVNTETAAFPDDRTALVVMSNRDPPAATTLFRKLREILFDPSALKACATNTPGSR